MFNFNIYFMSVSFYELTKDINAYSQKFLNNQLKGCLYFCILSVPIPIISQPIHFPPEQIAIWIISSPNQFSSNQFPSK